MNTSLEQVQPSVDTVMGMDPQLALMTVVWVAAILIAALAFHSIKKD